MSPSSDSQLLSNVEETTSDREVSELFDSNRSHSGKRHSDKGGSNMKTISQVSNEMLMKKMSGDSAFTNLPSSVRSCDSGTTTLTGTSLSSTMDSGYLTTDAESDMYSTSSYTKSLQRSAHSLYSQNRLNGLGNSGRKEIHDRLNQTDRAFIEQTSPKVQHSSAPIRQDPVKKLSSPNSNCQLLPTGEFSHTSQSLSLGKAINIGKGAEMTSTPLTSPQGNSQNVRSWTSGEKEFRSEYTSDSSFSSITSPQGCRKDEVVVDRINQQEIDITKTRGNSDAVQKGNLCKITRFPSAAQIENKTIYKPSLNRQMSLGNPQTDRVNPLGNPQIDRVNPLGNPQTDKVNSGLPNEQQPFKGDGKERVETASRVNGCHDIYTEIGNDHDIDQQGQGHFKRVRRDSMDRLMKCDIAVLPSTSLSSDQTLSTTNTDSIHDIKENGISSDYRTYFNPQPNFNFSVPAERMQENVCDNKGFSERNTSCLQSKLQTQAMPFKCDTQQNTFVPNTYTQRTTSVPVSLCPDHVTSAFLTQSQMVQEPTQLSIQPISNAPVGHVTLPTSLCNAPQSALYSMQTSNAALQRLQPGVTLTSQSLSNQTALSSLSKAPNQHLHHDYVNIPSSQLKGVGNVSRSLNSEIYGSVQNIYESQSSFAPLENVNFHDHYHTLPGKWRYNGHNLDGVSLTKCPSLYQFMQHYNFHSVHVELSNNMCLLDCINLRESTVSLSNVQKSKSDSSSSLTPQGKCPIIGGPGSAFKPVKAAPVNVKSFTMVTVAKVKDISHDLGSLMEGDVIVEVIF